jgi:hypothetical protein
MAKWITFSNGEGACHTYPAAKVMAFWKDWGFPITTYGGSQEYPDWHKLGKVELELVKDFEKKVFQEEVQEYIDKTWPRVGVTVVREESLPYAGSPMFGSGKEPGFCMHTAKCAGHGSCPRRYACSE